MTTITQKRKLSKSAWVLILIAFIAVVTLVITAAIGLIDLSPIGNAYLSIFSWGSSDVVNGILTGGLFFVLGVLAFYVTTRYFIGSKTTLPTGTQGYSPSPTYPASQPVKSGEETTIS